VIQHKLVVACRCESSPASCQEARLDRQWAERRTEKLVRFADDMVVICRTPGEAERALPALRKVLAELGLTLKDTKTRIVELREGEEGDRQRAEAHRGTGGQLCLLRRVRACVGRQHGAPGAVSPSNGECAGGRFARFAMEAKITGISRPLDASE
jgi:Reverse transcriptase (RNA-dependent DNA polymerase)